MVGRGQQSPLEAIKAGLRKLEPCASSPKAANPCEPQLLQRLGSKSLPHRATLCVHLRHQAPDPPTVVLFGNVGAGKSTIVERATGLTGLSSDQAASCTRKSCAYLTENDLQLVDAPGVDGEDRFQHVMEVAAALSLALVTKILITVAATDRIPSVLETLAQHAENLADFDESLLAVCVTHMDKVKWTAGDFREALEGMSFPVPAMFVHEESSKDEILADLLGLCRNQKAVHVQITEENFLKCFNFTDGHLAMHRVVQDAVARLKRLVEGFMESFNQLDGDVDDALVGFWDQVSREMDSSKVQIADKCKGLIFEASVMSDFQQGVLKDFENTSLRLLEPVPKPPTGPRRPSSASHREPLYCRKRSRQMVNMLEPDWSESAASTGGNGSPEPATQCGPRPLPTCSLLGLAAPACRSQLRSLLQLCDL